MPGPGEPGFHCIYHSIHILIQWILLMMKLKILAETVKIMVFVKMEMRGFNATALWDFMESIAKMVSGMLCGL